MSSTSIYKVCTRCEQSKLLTEYHKDKNRKDGHTTRCKQCCIEYKKQYNLDNKSKIKEWNDSYKELNNDKIKESGKLYRENNKELIAAKKRQYRQENKEKLKERDKKYFQSYKHTANEKMKEKLNSDPLFKLKHNIRSSILKAFVRNGFSKNSTNTTTILGCTFEELSSHLESQFLEGMSWDNRGEWHIDHIVPSTFGQTEEEIILLNHYSNLRPLWAADNISKFNKLTEEAVNHPIYHEIIRRRLIN